MTDMDNVERAAYVIALFQVIVPGFTIILMVAFLVGFLLAVF